MPDSAFLSIQSSVMVVNSSGVCSGSVGVLVWWADDTGGFPA